jgi:prostaglandin-endoperoxide synthase 2
MRQKTSDEPPASPAPRDVSAAGSPGRRPKPQRDRSRDGFANTFMFWLLTSLPWLWRFLQNRPLLEQFTNWFLICFAIKKGPPRPHRLSLKAPYVTWDALRDRSYFGRHLGPVDREYPDARKVAALFQRGTGRAGKGSQKSTVLFAYFAQWFTDAFMRTDFSNGGANRMRNSSNHHIDLCNLYGLTEAQTDVLREHRGGRLKFQTIDGQIFPPFLCDAHGSVKPEFADLPPIFGGNEQRMTAAHRRHLFAFGSDRGNITIGYAMMNVLFLRAHNYVAGTIQAANPSWDDERVFQTARNVLIVIALKIVVEEYINHITPYHFKFKLPAGKKVVKEWYRENWVTLEFNLLYRWHAMTPNVVRIGADTLPLQAALINNELLLTHGLAAAFAGASAQPAGEIGMFNTHDFLYARAEVPSIETARTARLASYNDYREICHFPRVTRFDQISSDPAVQEGLREVYGNVDAVELYAGLFAEDVRPNSVIGPLMGRMVGFDALSQALTNPLISDRLYTPDTFSCAGFTLVEESWTIDKLLSRTGSAPPNTARFTLKTFVRTSGSGRPETTPLELPLQNPGKGSPVPQLRTVNDAIVDNFTKKAEAQREADRAANPQSRVPPPMRRGAHPKHHGLVRATLEIHRDIPSDLRKGLFAKGGQTFDAYARFSNSGRDPDSVPDAHGMAIKVVRVPGLGLLDEERHTQDFVLVDSPVFIARSPEDFLAFMDLARRVAVAKMQRAPELPALNAELAEKFPNVKDLKKLIPSPLTVPYWSQVPYALGDDLAVKYLARPRVLDLQEPSGTLTDNYLHDRMKDVLSGRAPVVFDFMVQRRVGDMPLDDPTIEWAEALSPFVPVATLTIPPQPDFDNERQRTFAEDITFSPWHALPEHRPLGRINEARREVYQTMQKQRHTPNGVQHREPTGHDDF